MQPLEGLARMGHILGPVGFYNARLVLYHFVHREVFVLYWILIVLPVKEKKDRQTAACVWKAVRTQHLAGLKYSAPCKKPKEPLL